MTLLEKLAAKGVKTYSSTPLYQFVNQVDTVVIGDNVVVANNKFDQPQLVIQEGDTVMYIPLMKGTAPDKDSYTLSEYTATRDYESVVSGTSKIFAS